MARKYQGKAGTVEVMGLKRYWFVAPPPPSAPPAPQSGSNFDVKLEGEAGREIAYQKLGMEQEQSNRAWGAYSEDRATWETTNDRAFYGTVAVMGAQTVMGIFGGILQFQMIQAQIEAQEKAQEKAQALQEKVMDHKIALEDATLEAQSALASKKLETEKSLATIEKNRQVEIAKIQADAGVKKYEKKLTAAAFLPPPNYGGPIAV